MIDDCVTGCDRDQVVSLALWPFDVATRDALLEKPHVCVLTAPSADGGGGTAMLLIHHCSDEGALMTAREQVEALLAGAGVGGQVVAISTVRLDVLRTELAVELPEVMHNDYDPSELMACYLKLCRMEYHAA